MDISQNPPNFLHMVRSLVEAGAFSGCFSPSQHLQVDMGSKPVCDMALTQDTRDFASCADVALVFDTMPACKKQRETSFWIKSFGPGALLGGP